jgi:hypothetical protein
MKKFLLCFLVHSVLVGCATVDEIETRQLAYRGEGDNPCRWGGVSERADAHCAELRWGIKGYLTAINDHARRHLPDAADASPCMEHVARLQSVLAGRHDLTSEMLFSCPPDRGDGRCHVSLLVTDRQQRQYVLDNGAVFGGTQAPGAVGSLVEFAALAGPYRRVAPPPPAVTALGPSGRDGAIQTSTDALERVAQVF